MARRRRLERLEAELPEALLGPPRDRPHHDAATPHERQRAPGRLGPPRLEVELHEGAPPELLADEVLRHVPPAETAGDERVLRREIDDPPRPAREHAAVGWRALRIRTVLAEDD